MKKIGKEGKIFGVDYSPEMLKIEQKRIKKKKWKNIELREADIAQLKEPFDTQFNVGVCTLGISIFQDFNTAYANLVSNIKKQGEIIIGDMQLAPGRLARLNLFTVFLAKRYGGSYEGHQNSIELYKIMKNELNDVIKREFFFKSYFYCIGKTV